MREIAPESGHFGAPFRGSELEEDGVVQLILAANPAPPNRRILEHVAQQKEISCPLLSAELTPVALIAARGHLEKANFLGEFFQLRSTNSKAMFFNVTRKNQGSKPPAGMVIVSMPPGGTLTCSSEMASCMVLACSRERT